MPRVVFEPMIPVFRRPKTLSALDRSAKFWIIPLKRTRPPTSTSLHIRKLFVIGQYDGFIRPCSIKCLSPTLTFSQSVSQPVNQSVSQPVSPVSQSISQSSQSVKASSLGLIQKINAFIYFCISVIVYSYH